MYSGREHGMMLANRIRVGSYRRALELTVRPGDVVVDIGSGTGIFAIFAAQLGACRVYAIESSEVIELGREIAARNGCADRIEFIRDVSLNVTLPQKANVIVSDLRGALPFLDRGLESLIDARQRFLAPGGTMIPRRDSVWLAAANLPHHYYDECKVWDDNRWGVDLSLGRRFGFDSPVSVWLEPEDLLTEVEQLVTLDYYNMSSASASGRVRLTATRDGEANGYLMGFISELASGVSFNTGPGHPRTVYPNRFAPWSQAVSFHAGDTIDADLSFTPVRDEYLCAWNTCIIGRQGERRAEFRQSSFNSSFVTMEPIRKRSPNHSPRLNNAGAGAQVLLGLMDGERTLEEVAELACQQRPDLFSDRKRALQAAADVSAKYSE